MPTSPNQKMKLLYLMRIFLEQTDEDHTMTIKEMIRALDSYGIKAERKSIYSDIEMLRRFGLDIEMQHSKTFGYYVASREFELPELKLLADAVQGSRFITDKKSNGLIHKLTTLTSCHLANQLKRQALMTSRPKAANESIYYSIDAIHQAIGAGKKISFKYFDYNIGKQRVYRRASQPYILTPLSLCWHDDKYYLISYNAKYDSYNHYCVDRMSEVFTIEEPADKVDRKRFNVSKHIRETLGMFSGEVVEATLRFDVGLINTVLDQFGSDLKLTRAGDCFQIIVNVSQSPVFYSWIIQFGNQAEIIEPDELRTGMRNLLDELALLYQDK